MKTKYWLVIGTFALIIMTALTITSVISDRDLGFEHNGVTLSEQDYLSIQEEFDSQIVRVCNIENKNCIALIPLK